MDRGHVKDMLLDLIYNELPPKEAETVQEHLARCGECSAELKRLEETLALTRRIADPEVPPYLNARVLARACEPKPRNLWSRVLRPQLAMAAVAVIAASVVIVIGIERGFTPPRETAPLLAPAEPAREKSASLPVTALADEEAKEPAAPAQPAYYYQAPPPAPAQPEASGNVALNAPKPLPHARPAAPVPPAAIGNAQPKKDEGVAKLAEADQLAVLPPRSAVAGGVAQAPAPAPAPGAAGAMRFQSLEAAPSAPASSVSSAPKSSAPAAPAAAPPPAPAPPAEAKAKSVPMEEEERAKREADAAAGPDAETRKEAPSPEALLAKAAETEKASGPAAALPLYLEALAALGLRPGAAPPACSPLLRPAAEGAARCYRKLNQTAKAAEINQALKTACPPK